MATLVGINLHKLWHWLSCDWLCLCVARSVAFTWTCRPLFTEQRI